MVGKKEASEKKLRMKKKKERKTRQHEKIKGITFETFLLFIIDAKIYSVQTLAKSEVWMLSLKASTFI